MHSIDRSIMNKLLLFTLFVVLIGVTVGKPGHGFLSFFGLNPFRLGHSSTSFCANTTVAQTYLAQTLALINNLQLNSTYNSVLQLQWSNFIAYLQNSTNQALLSTNCTIFVTNLKAAKVSDQTSTRQRQQINSDIERQFQQVERNVTGTSGFTDLDTSSSEENHRRF